MKDATFAGLPIRKNKNPAARWCKTCGRKHARGHCLLVPVKTNGRVIYRDFSTNEAMNAHSGANEAA